MTDLTNPIIDLKDLEKLFQVIDPTINTSTVINIMHNYFHIDKGIRYSYNHVVTII